MILLWVIRVIIVALALLFGLLGMGFLFEPIPASGRVGLEAMDLTGMSTLRGDIAGLFLASAVMMLLGLRRGQGTWLLAVAVLMGVIAAGRLVGFAVDGSTNQAVVTLLVELGMVVFLPFAAWRLPQLTSR